MQKKNQHLGPLIFQKTHFLGLWTSDNVFDRVWWETSHSCDYTSSKKSVPSYDALITPFTEAVDFSNIFSKYQLKFYKVPPRHFSHILPFMMCKKCFSFNKKARCYIL